MTEAICYRDAYARSVEAVVTRREADPQGPLVVLDRSVFYPGGGGQPADRGMLEDAASGTRWSVTTCRRAGEELLHEVDGDGPAVGDRVRAELDWDRRYQLMRTHTALHALCGVVWRDHGAQVTGGNMEPGRGRMDFEFEALSAELVGSIEARVNEELAQGREVRVSVLPRQEAFRIPDLIRTKVNLLPEGISEVRVVEIVGLDVQADGGTHVSNTNEVGRVVITGYESKGRINKRIRIRLDDPD